MKKLTKNIKSFNRCKQMRKKENGITLIALAVTIIVLIILAGISITSLTGEKGLINQARTNSENAQRESIIEKIEADLLKEKTKTGDTPSKDKLKEIIQENEYNDGTLGEDSFVTKDGGYTINYNEIDGWENYMKIDELIAGQYVNYIDGKGNTLKCIVLYDTAYNDSHETNYGVQIITVDTVEKVILGYNDNTITGSNDFEKARNSYNNALKTLYNKAQEYLNPTYASVARSVGSVPNDPDWDTDKMYKNDNVFVEKYNNIFKIEDDNYTTDYEQIINLNLKTTSDDYLLASRTIVFSEGYIGFNIYFIINGTNNLGHEALYYDYYRDDNIGYNDLSYASLRPVFKLNPNVKIVGGEGTEENPYTLGE